MANITPLTAKLQAFKDTVSPSISSMESTKNEIANYLNEATTAYESAYNGITSAITDDQGKAASQSLALVKQAIEVMKSSITNDMGNILSECSKISEEITRIESEIERGNNLTPGWWERVWNDIVGFFTSKWCDNDAGEISRIKEEVEHSMKALEAQLDAIASSSNSIRLGIIGNMVAGGTLGSYIDFASNYNFNLQQWKEENPIYHANFFGKTACFVVGQVEGVVKFFEGIADAVLITGAAITQGVGWIFGQDWSQNIFSEAAKFDIAGSITGFAYDALKSIGQYDENYRTAGNIVGQVVSALALNPTVALYIMAASSAGQAGESSLQAGNTSIAAFGTGAVVGGITLITGKVLNSLVNTPLVQNVYSKAGSWLSSGSIPANMVKSAGNFVGKAANILTKPAQWTSRGIITAGKAVGTTITSSVSSIGNKISNSKIGQGVKNLYNKFTPSGTPAGDSLPSSEVNIGMYGKTSKMTFNEAQKNLAMLKKMDWQSYEGTPVYDEMLNLWQESTATIADATYGSASATLKQTGNLYQNSLNAAKYYGSQGVVQQPNSWNNYADAVYKIGGVDIGTFSAPQATQGVLDRVNQITGVSRTPATANGAPSSAADSALAQVDDATFNAYQQANGIKTPGSRIIPTILSSANVIRNNNDN